jgi:hypothetical protein
MSEKKTPQIPMTTELIEWYEILVEAREQKAGWDEREKEAKAQITRILGARDTDVLGQDGKPVLRAVNRPGNFGLNTAKLKAEMPDVYERYKKMNAGSYRLELVDPEATE